jgi:hypothetical protein
MTPSPRAPERFALEKWYMDAVDSDGSAAIAYWASLTWMGVDVTWHNVCHYGRGARRPRSGRACGTFRLLAWSTDA